MSEGQKETLSLPEFVRKKKEQYHDELVRVKTYAHETKETKGLVGAESFWGWMEEIHEEFENLYIIVDRLLNSDRYSVNVSKQILGLNELASTEDLNARTKEFGELVNVLIRKKQEWEQEDKLKERLT
jgi:hypothetical protein